MDNEMTTGGQWSVWLFEEGAGVAGTGQAVLRAGQLSWLRCCHVSEQVHRTIRRQWDEHTKKCATLDYRWAASLA